ncbi:unnamed protein product [Darwinula stevensoni]|uniref:receptor protein-tyrosine kinase n=1 Tax=Darwinula stevensoni TaxID=69355 RepID=A0A7R8X4J9_9CRUS|nr:unnamed protein product [Darwinula stevensoni]CAG0886128.1 unnamed protein product [Darwinula stevensoni]
MKKEFKGNEKTKLGDVTEGRIRQKDYSNGLPMTRLIVSNATDADAGPYRCIATAFESTEESTHEITVRGELLMFISHPVLRPDHYPACDDPEATLKLTPRTTEGIASVGESIIWEVEVEADANDKPKLVFKRNGLELSTGPKYTVEKGLKSASLEIKNISLEDEGPHELEGIVGRNRQTVSFQLSVKSGADATAGIAATSASVISLVGLIVGSISYYRFRKERALNIAVTKEDLENFQKGQPNKINPALGLSEQAHLLPYHKAWEFAQEKLTLGKPLNKNLSKLLTNLDETVHSTTTLPPATGDELGHGAFAVVMKAVAAGIHPQEQKTTVAVKKRHHHCNLEHYLALMMELKIMCHLGRHLNVVNLLGACTKDMARGNLMVIVEYCPFGSLDGYLRTHADCFINQIDSETGQIKRDIPIPSSEKPNIALTTSDLISWAFQIAEGMKYLASRKMRMAFRVSPGCTGFGGEEVASLTGKQKDT